MLNVNEDIEILMMKARKILLVERGERESDDATKSAKGLII